MKKIITIIGIMAVCLMMCSCVNFDWDEECISILEDGSMCKRPAVEYTYYCARHYRETFGGLENYSKQCAAKTKNGTRCKRKAEKNSIYCWQHK